MTFPTETSSEVGPSETERPSGQSGSGPGPFDAIQRSGGQGSIYKDSAPSPYECLLDSSEQGRATEEIRFGKKRPESIDEWRALLMSHSAWRRIRFITDHQIIGRHPGFYARKLEEKLENP